MQLSMTTPPINETVFGLHLNRSYFNASFFGRYYEKIKNKFPKISSKTPIFPASGEHVISFENMCPRIWFESDENRNLIQLQDDRFHFNWRNQDKEEYPGFNTVYSSFEREWSNYVNWLNDDKLMPENLITQLELSYINHIEDDLVLKNDLSGVQKILKTFTHPSSLENYKINNLTMNQTYSLGDDGIISNAIKVAERTDNQKKVLILEITARSNKKNYNHFSDWFHKIHGHISEIFFETTTTTAHKKWGLKVNE